MNVYDIVVCSQIQHGTVTSAAHYGSVVVRVGSVQCPDVLRVYQQGHQPVSGEKGIKFRYNCKIKYVSFSVGGAITAKSIPENEYEECLLKAKAMREVLES